jgi:hypothetical protein
MPVTFMSEGIKLAEKKILKTRNAENRTVMAVIVPK